MDGFTAPVEHILGGIHQAVPPQTLPTVLLWCPRLVAHGRFVPDQRLKPDDSQGLPSSIAARRQGEMAVETLPLAKQSAETCALSLELELGGVVHNEHALVLCSA